MRFLDLPEQEQLEAFLSVPASIGPADTRAAAEPPYWVRRQLSGGNPYFRHAGRELLVLEHGGRLCARASLVFPGESPEEAFFGFLEAVPEAFDRLIDGMKERCRRRGVARLLGPFSPHPYGATGLQLDAFDTPAVFFEPATRPEHVQLLHRAGFTEVQRGRAWRVEPAGVPTASHPARSGPYRVRRLRLGTFSRAIRTVSGIFEASFAANWYARPIAFREYLYTAVSLLPALRRGLTLWVERDGQPIGAAIVLANIAELSGPAASLPAALRAAHRRTITSATVLAVGMLPGYRRSRGGLLLYHHVRHALAAFRTVTTSWITEGNLESEGVAAHLGMRPYKTFAVVARTVEQ